MRIVFMGTPVFAAPVLEAVVSAGHEVAAVYSRPDRPSGRGKRTSPTPVKAAALAMDIPVRQPPSLKPLDVRAELAALAPDVIVVAAYGLFLPREVLDLPRHSCLNIHPSLLPKLRGPSPVSTAIVDGETTTGVTIMVMDEGVDTGPVLAQRRTPIGEGETAEGLTARLFETGARLLVEALPDWAGGRTQASPQDESQATITRLLSREDGRIDWSEGADRIARRVRGYTPWPGSHTYWDGRMLKIIEASPGDRPAADRPGRVAESSAGDRIDVSTGRGTLRVGRLQLEGRRAASAREFLQGNGSIAGAHLGP